MSASKKATKVSAKMLDDSHQHAGKNCANGKVITLRKEQADTLVKLNKAEIIKGETSETAQSE